MRRYSLAVLNVIKYSLITLLYANGKYALAQKINQKWLPAAAFNVNLRF